MAEGLKGESLQTIRALFKEESSLHAFLTSRDPQRSLLGSLTIDELQKESDALLGEKSLTEEEARKISFGVVSDHRQEAFKSYRLVMLRRILGNDSQEATQNFCRFFQPFNQKTGKKKDKKKLEGFSCFAKVDPREIKTLLTLTGWPDKKEERCQEPNCYPLESLLMYLKGASGEKVLTALRKAVSESLQVSLTQIQD